jgi:hypothetical protein
MKVNRIECGKIVHDYFGRANPSFETINDRLWLEVDYIVGRDMNDCFEAEQPVVIDGVKYAIEELQSRSSGLAGRFRLRRL